MIKKFLVVATLAICALFVFVACGGDNDGGGEITSVTLVDFSWDSILVHNRIVANILEGAFGVDVNFVQAESAPGLLGLTNGDVDIAMEVWIDNRADWFDEHSGNTIVPFGSVFSGETTEGWFVPYYIEEIIGVPITSVHCLVEHWELMKVDGELATFFNAPTGWNSHEINRARFYAYGLEGLFNLTDPGSSAALDIAIIGEFERRVPFVMFYWSPTALLGRLDMIHLEEPPHNPDTWNFEGGFASAYPGARVFKLVNKEFYDNPNSDDILEVIRNYQIYVPHINRLLYEQEESGLSYDEFVRQLMLEDDFWHVFVPANYVQNVITHLNR